MPRFLIIFPDPMLKWLRAEAKKLGISVSELARRIIDERRLNPNERRTS